MSHQTETWIRESLEWLPVLPVDAIHALNVLPESLLRLPIVIYPQNEHSIAVMIQPGFWPPAHQVIDETLNSHRIKFALFILTAADYNNIRMSA